MADPKYLSVASFKAEAPEKRLAELSQDTPNSYEVDDEKVKQALLWAEGMFESKIVSRSDYTLKKAEVVEGSDDAATVREFIYDLTMYKLFKRREHIPEAIQTAFDVQMTWISDVVARRADIPVFDDDGDQIDTQSHMPEIDKTQKNEFSDYKF